MQALLGYVIAVHVQFDQYRAVVIHADLSRLTFALAILAVGSAFEFNRFPIPLASYRDIIAILMDSELDGPHIRALAFGRIKLPVAAEIRVILRQRQRAGY